MDILDFLDILLKPPQPLMGLFFFVCFAVLMTLLLDTMGLKFIES